MITDLNQILVEWAYRTNDGKPDANNSAKVLVLETVLSDFGWSEEARAELLNSLMEAREKKPKGWFVNDKDKAVYRTVDYAKKKDWPPASDDQIKKAEDDDDGEEETQSQNTPEMDAMDAIVSGPEIDINKTTDTEVGAKIKPFIEKASKTITELVNAGNKQGAKALAQHIIDKYHITKPLYLQPDKKGLGKIKIGTKYKNFMGGKNAPSKYQQKIMDAIQSSGAVIPLRKKGISPTTMAPNQVHANFDENGKPQFKSGKIKLIKNKKGEPIGREVQIGKRKFVVDIDPNDELSRLKIETLPTGSVDFIDINSADTPEGRTECIVNATNNLNDTISKIGVNFTDRFNKGVAKKLKEQTQELQKLEKKKNAVESEEEKEKLQKEFYDKSLELLETTKIENPEAKGVNEFNSMASYISETIEAVNLLNQGVETYIPASGNFTTNDVVSFRKGKIQPRVVTTDGMSADEMNMLLANEDHLELGGASVKFAGGSASQLTNKIEMSTFKDDNVKLKINGKMRKGTKEVLLGLTKAYNNLFPDTGAAPKALTKTEIKTMMDESRQALYEFYPKVMNPKNKPNAEKEMIEKIKKKVIKQLDRLNQDKVAKGEGYANAAKRMELYHYTQFVNVAIHNHPKRGLEGQAFANSDYESSIVNKKVKIDRIHSDGVKTLSYAGLDIDMGYTVSKTGKITPTNVYSSRLKHSNENPFMDQDVKKIVGAKALAALHI